jgi:hypothetical protein
MVFLLGVVGFGIALMGMFTDKAYGFPNLKETFFTLFSSGLGWLSLYHSISLSLISLCLSLQGTLM